MENLRNIATNELYNKIDELLYYLLTHNKNYTKKQFETIDTINDILQEIKDR